MNTKTPKLLAAVLLLAAGASSAHAALIAYEGFSYGTSGSSNLDGLNGGSGWGSAWAGDGIGSGSFVAGLSYGSLVTDGVGGAYTNFPSFGNANANPRRTFGSAITSGTVWISFLSSDSGSAPNFHSLLLSSDVNAETSDALSIGQSFGGSTRVVFGSAVTAGADTGVSTQGGGFNLVEINLDNGTGNLWANPGLGSSSPTGPSFSFTHTLTSINGLAIRGSEPVVFDEIRVGTAFADVAPIPEPSSAAALLGLAAAGMTVLRRRRST